MPKTPEGFYGQPGFFCVARDFRERSALIVRATKAKQAFVAPFTYRKFLQVKNHGSPAYSEKKRQGQGPHPPRSSVTEATTGT